MKNETLIYGIRAVMEAVEASNSIDKVFVQRGLNRLFRTNLFSY